MHIVGLSGIEGYAVASFLVAHGIRNIVAHDFHSLEEFRREFTKLHLYLGRKQRKAALDQLATWPIQIRYQGEYLQGIESADLIYLSQNWFAHPCNEPLRPLVESGRVALSSLTKLYLQLAPCPVIGITGSLGKSTTTQMAAEILMTFFQLNGSGRRVEVGGNDRRSGQALAELESLQPHDVLVLEMSNRQLRLDPERSPHIGVLTNVLPNHLQEHDGFTGYREVKERIFRYQSEDDRSVFNADDPVSREIRSAYANRAFSFSCEQAVERGAYIFADRILITDPDTSDEPRSVMKTTDLRLAGRHNLSNLLAALTAAYVHVLPTNDERQWHLFCEAAQTVARRFAGLPGRMEHVPSGDGVLYYYDIKSTTPHGTLAALQTLVSLPKAPERFMLIAGGDDKGLAYDELAQAVIDHVSKVYLLPGAGSERLRSAILALQTGYPVTPVQSLQEAWQAVQTNKKAGDAIVLSPACPGFYSMYLAGTIGFKELVNGLPAG